MSHNFSQIVDDINKLDLDEKIEIANILDKSIAETRREEFYNDYHISKTEKRVFSDNLEVLKSTLDGS